MKPKTMILLGLAVTCGLGASYMTSRLLAERQPSDDQKVNVLVAKRNLSVGESIRKPEDLFEVKQFVSGQEPKEAIQIKDLKELDKEMEPLKGKIMKQSLRKGDHITGNDVSGDGGLQIPEGYQACGFPVNPVNSAAGFASLPLSRVDIILVIRRNDDKSSQSRVLLQNVLVLAADTEVGRDKGMAAPAQVVTFALKPEDILKVEMAAKIGTLSLALRKQGDRTLSTTPVVTVESLLSNDTKKEDDTGVSVPKLVAKQAPTDLPKLAAKHSGEEPPVMQAAPPVEDSRNVRQNLTILNGTRQERFGYDTTPDGRALSSDDGAESGLAPPRKQLSPPKTSSSDF